MFFTNLTRANEIGANSYWLDFGVDGSVVLDSGMHPRIEGYSGTPLMDLVPKETLKAIFLTHAHHDHMGSLPILMRHQPQAPVFMSEGTRYLTDSLLHNSVEVMFKQKAEKGIPEFPLYTHKEIDRGVDRWLTCGIDRTWSLEGRPAQPEEPLSFQFHDAGHVLGSVAVELIHRGRRILYTGDINFRDQTLMKGAELPQEGIDTLIIETTRGNHSNPPGFTREGELSRLAKGIEETFEKGGSVMIPAFALGKTQELLAALYLLQKKKEIRKGTIYIGGLGRLLTLNYDRLCGRVRRNNPRLVMLDEIQPEIMDGRRLQGFRPRPGDIYLITSGMMTEKTLSNTFAQRLLADKRHSIFFVGYCDPDSPAGRLLATPKGERVCMDSSTDEDQPIHCRIEKFDMTAHAQREDILDYIVKLNPRVCLLVHGD
ncbi:MAG: MBL fold metallo-hydrolase, partial [Verrucomicrobiota bacterium]